MYSGPRKKYSRQLDQSLTTSQILSWARTFKTFTLFNSNSELQEHQDLYHRFDFLLAAGALEILNGENFFSSLQQMHTQGGDWLCGYLSYDLKNQTEDLHSRHKSENGFPDFHFFRPLYIISINDKHICVEYYDETCNVQSAAQLIEQLIISQPAAQSDTFVHLKARVSRDHYLEQAQKLKDHIQQGDIYEVNYCMEFNSENSITDPYSLYLRLNEISPMPFSAFYKFDDKYILCASPERFIAGRGKKIISQPVKGTAKKGRNIKEDEEIKNSLRNDPKERSENVMIVDLVRNDLSRTAAKGSVQVEELFGIKTFRQLHQMISTVISEKKDNADIVDVIKNAFPMGSMTGAPKIRAMELIDHYESSSRSVYSGAIGYIDPDKNFDFNVVIRTILYNNSTKYLSFSTGSALTAAADPEMEYEECMLKAKGIIAALSQPGMM
jgi:para-aminobenzoate synthetase component I